MKAILLAGLLAALGAPVAAQDAMTLPGGASALNETHGDWVVHCEAQMAQVVCALQQEQLDASTRQRVLAVELAPRDGSLSGTLILPFGLALENGVRLQIDGGTPLPALRFRTCLPTGCLVNLALLPDAVAVLRSGTAITVTASADGGGETPFNISLKGFAGALDRTVALTQ